MSHFTSKGQTFGSIKSIILPLPISFSTRRLFWLIIRMPIFIWTRHGRIYGGIANYTSQKGTQMQFSLSVHIEHSRNVLVLRLTIITGTVLSWYGLKPTELPRGPTTTSYIVDNQSAVTFTLPGLPKADIPTQYRQKFFETLTLPFALHKFTVTLMAVIRL